jgi:hypothetical protein
MHIACPGLGSSISKCTQITDIMKITQGGPHYVLLQFQYRLPGYEL